MSRRTCSVCGTHGHDIRHCDKHVACAGVRLRTLLEDWTRGQWPAYPGFDELLEHVDLAVDVLHTDTELAAATIDDVLDRWPIFANFENRFPIAPAWRALALQARQHLIRELCAA